MLRYPTFDAMFSTTENKIDMFKHLQNGDIVLISSPKAILGTEGSQLFSRYMVALTLQAAFERLTISREKWHPAFLVIDEAQDVMDEVKTQELLQQARQFKLGVTVAHQQIRPQLTDALFSTISANTRIKYVGTRSHEVAAPMARDMFCDPEFVMKRPVGEFACFVGGMTDHPFVVSLEDGEIKKLPKMHPDLLEPLVDIMTEQYGVAGQVMPTITQKSPETEGLRESADKPTEAPVATAAEKKIIEKKDPSKPTPWGKG